METKEFKKQLTDISYNLNHGHLSVNEALIKLKEFLEPLFTSKQVNTPTDELLQELYDKCNQDMITKSDFYLSGFSDGLNYDNGKQAEMPTDEEVEKEAENRYPDHNNRYSPHSNYVRIGFKECAKWMRDQMRASNPKEGEYYSMDECVFEYCPNPDHCKFETKCQNPKS